MNRTWLFSAITFVCFITISAVACAPSSDQQRNLPTLMATAALPPATATVPSSPETVSLPTTAPPSSTPDPSQPAVRVRAVVVMRRGPGYAHTRISTHSNSRVAAGTIAIGLEYAEVDDGKWYHIELPDTGASGWIPAYLVEVIHGEIPIAQQLPPPPAAKTRRATTGSSGSSSSGSSSGSSGSVGCCKMCRTGKACGNSCISRNKTCHQPPGCACNGAIDNFGVAAIFHEILSETVETSSVCLPPPTTFASING